VQSEVMDALVNSDIGYTIFFYNTNFHPRKEYALHKNNAIPW
jgi:predicted adenine nucleotide alpha hydrolase (AANH) superfamily ATPase